MPVEQRGQVIAVEHGPTGSNREEPEGSAGRRQPSRGDTSRMNREVQVRICEGLGVKLPGPTRQSRRCRQRLSTAGLPSTAEEPQPWPSRPESDRPQIAPERNTTSCNVLKERAAQERKSLSRRTFRSTSRAREALLSMSTAPPGSHRAWLQVPGLWWCKHRDGRCGSRGRRRWPAG